MAFVNRPAALVERAAEKPELLNSGLKEDRSKLDTNAANPKKAAKIHVSPVNATKPLSFCCVQSAQIKKARCGPPEPLR